MPEPFVVVIPARYGSARLPGKPLIDIAGAPLIQRVHECASESSAQEVIVATDDERIAIAVEGFGGRTVMTRDDHPSGTDRLAEVCERLALSEERIVVNLQGDEPLMPPGLIDQVSCCLESDPTAAIATAREPIDDGRSFRNPDVVKVVCDRDGRAITFSRAPVPWPRDEREVPRDAWRHIGIYAYRRSYLRRFAARGACEIEKIEKLEQLRALWHGERIAVCTAKERPGPGVDTPEDLRLLRAMLG